MGRLKSLNQAIGKPLRGLVAWPKKEVDPFYNSPAWSGPGGLRQKTLERDGFQCTAVISGSRCANRAIIADHIKRRRDGGGDEMSNLRALCRDCDNRLKERWDGTRCGSDNKAG